MLRRVEGVIQLDAKCFIAEIALNHFAEKTDAQHGATDAARVQHFQLVREKRPAGDGHERLGDFFRDGPQPRGEATRENGDGDFCQ